jgi:hypothetical protein
VCVYTSPFPDDLRLSLRWDVGVVVRLFAHTLPRNALPSADAAAAPRSKDDLVRVGSDTNSGRIKRGKQREQ